MGDINLAKTRIGWPGPDGRKFHSHLISRGKDKIALKILIGKKAIRYTQRNLILHFADIGPNSIHFPFFSAKTTMAC